MSEHIDAHGIFVKPKDGKRGQWYAGQGFLTSRRVHAVVTWAPEGVDRFKEACERLAEQNPEYSFEVRKL